MVKMHAFLVLLHIILVNGLQIPDKSRRVQSTDIKIFLEYVISTLVFLDQNCSSLLSNRAQILAFSNIEGQNLKSGYSIN